MIFPSGWLQRQDSTASVMNLNCDVPGNREYSPGISSEYIPGYSSEYIPGISSEYIPGYSSEYIPGISSEYIPGISSEYIPGYSTEYIPGYSSGYIHWNILKCIHWNVFMCFLSYLYRTLLFLNNLIPVDIFQDIPLNIFHESWIFSSNRSANNLILNLLKFNQNLGFNRKSVITIQIWFRLRRFAEKISSCEYLRFVLFHNNKIKMARELERIQLRFNFCDSKKITFFFLPANICVSTRRDIYFLILVMLNEIRLYLSLCDWFIAKRNSIWFKINRTIIYECRTPEYMN